MERDISFPTSRSLRRETLKLYFYSPTLLFGLGTLVVLGFAWTSVMVLQAVKDGEKENMKFFVVKVKCRTV